MLLNSCEYLVIQFNPLVLLPVDSFVPVSVKFMYFKVIPLMKVSNCCEYHSRIRGCDSTSLCCVWLALAVRKAAKDWLYDICMW